jgi:hypothetical protein
MLKQSIACDVFFFVGFQIPGTTFAFEYLCEFETKFQKKSGWTSGARIGSICNIYIIYINIYVEADARRNPARKMR